MSIYIYGIVSIQTRSLYHLHCTVPSLFVSTCDIQSSNASTTKLDYLGASRTHRFSRVNVNSDIFTHPSVKIPVAAC